jgi:hypothetical protein
MGGSTSRSSWSTLFFDKLAARFWVFSSQATFSHHQERVVSDCLPGVPDGIKVGVTGWHFQHASEWWQIPAHGCFQTVLGTNVYPQPCGADWRNSAPDLSDIPGESVASLGARIILDSKRSSSNPETRGSLFESGSTPLPDGRRKKRLPSVGFRIWYHT